MQFNLKPAVARSYIGRNQTERVCELPHKPLIVFWSGQQDLNLRPQRPERCALPD